MAKRGGAAKVPLGQDCDRHCSGAKDRERRSQQQERYPDSGMGTNGRAHVDKNRGPLEGTQVVI